MPHVSCAFCSAPLYKRPSQISKGARFCSHKCYVSEKARVKSETMPGGMARCSKCREVQPETNFYTQGSKGRGTWCKSCRCADEKRRRESHSHILQFHKRYETDMDFRARELIRAIGKRARREGVAMDLDIPWLSARLQSGRCELTGLPFNYSVAGRKPNPFTPSVDRIMAGKGYTKVNCRVVLRSVNFAMNDWGLDVLVRISEALMAKMGRASA